MKADSQVSIVIPNYNGMAFMEACMQAVLRDAPKAELIVVDNASKDGSLEYTREHFPEARVLAMDQNYGFARAVNEGILAATRPYVILLNNDTEVEPGFTDALVGALEADARAFSAQAKLIQLQDPLKLDDAGNFYCALGWAFARGKDKPSADYEEQDEVFAACAGAAVYRKALFEEIGYFDEAHFAYLEDIDIGWRARIFGYRNLYVPKARVLHAGSGTSGSRYNEFKVTLSSRNNIWIIYKNMPLLQLVLNLPFLVVGFGAKQLFFCKKKLGGTYARGILKGIRTCDREKKVRFMWKHFPAYARLQWELWRNIARKIIV